MAKNIVWKKTFHTCLCRVREDGIINAFLDFHNSLKLEYLTQREGSQKILIFCFMFDYTTKIRMRAYNVRKVVEVSRLEYNLTAAEVSKANKDLHDPYASYGTDVPHCIPGSKQYWKAFGLNLVAMTQQLGIPDFFLTLSPNDSSPHIQLTIKRSWGARAEPYEFNDHSIEKTIKCLLDQSHWNLC